MWILSAATLVNRSGTMVLAFLVLYVTHTLGVTPARAALALMVYGLAALVTMPLAGILSDRVGPLPIMKASLFLTGILLLLFPLAKSYSAILLMTLAFAVLNESVRPASLSMVSDLVGPAQRKAAFALSRLAANLGMSVGPAIGGILAVYSFRWLFLVDGTTSILAGAVLALAPMRNLGRQTTHEPEWADATDLGREIEADSVAPLAALHPAADLRAFRNPRMLYFLAALIPVQLVFFQFTSTLPLFLVRYLHFPESVYGTIFTVNTLLIVALEVPLNTAMAHLDAQANADAGRVSLRGGIWIVCAGGDHAVRANSGRFCGRSDLDVRRNDSDAGQLGVRGGNRAAGKARRVHGAVHYVVQYRVCGGAVARGERPGQVGRDDGVGRGVCIGLHFDAADEPHRTAQRSSGNVSDTLNIRREKKDARCVPKTAGHSGR